MLNSYLFRKYEMKEKNIGWLENEPIFLLEINNFLFISVVFKFI